MTTLRLAFCGPPRGVRTGLQPRPGVPTENLPAMLVSTIYLERWQRERKHFGYRSWILDSGAFSIHNSAKSIDCQEYTDTCLELLENDPLLDFVFALDVIGDPEAGMRNTEEMWRQGVPAVPCYHCGESKEVLTEIGRQYPMIAISGSGAKFMHRNKRLDFFAECFAEVWPKKIHGFAMVTMDAMRALPFWSVDSSTWQQNPSRWGIWHTMQGTGKRGKVSIHGGQQNYRSEVDWYLNEEQQCRARWRKQIAELEAIPDIRPDHISSTLKLIR